MIDTLSGTPEWKQLEASGLTPVARHGFGMAGWDETILVFGGLVQTPGRGVLRSNDLWLLNPRKMNTTWTKIIPEGTGASLQERSHFGFIQTGATLVSAGGSGNFGSFSQIHQIDLCRIQKCKPGFKISCDWDPLNEKRGVCVPCDDGEYCCRKATYVATTGLCTGYNITLSSCSPSHNQWQGLMQALAPSVYPDEQDCKSTVQQMCSSIVSPGLFPPKALDNPLLCDKMFLCATDSPFGSSKFAPNNICGVKGTTCKASIPGSSICCSYIERLIARSCSAMPQGFIGFLARSRFPSCDESAACYDPPEFQATELQTSNRGPSCREGARAAVIGESMFIFGGLTVEGEYSQELWELRSNAYHPIWVDWSSLRGGPFGRRDAAVTSLQPSGKLLVHGGEGSKFLYDDLYVLDTLLGSPGAQFKWADVKPVMDGDIPSERSLHSMVGVSATDAYLFGGRTLYGVSSEVRSARLIAS
jgi:hypothetical protein